MTGGNGFIGSHLVQRLLGSRFEVTCLLRETSDTRFIGGELPQVRTCVGELRDAASLAAAVRGADAVVHCAGTTAALRRADYFAVNEQGTRNLVDACSAPEAGVRHLVVLSSLAAAGPGTVERPAAETDRPAPVSAYG
ncbi:MAG: NAD(P)H-binding protein, partial [Candidatus Brocadiia bacterium]